MMPSNRREQAYIPEERAAARTCFRDCYGADLRFAPVLVVIDDGSSDGTVARMTGSPWRRHG